jgi:signal transduction histidine kinase
MAGQLRSYRESQTEKIIRMHKMMQTTLASFPDPIFVFASDGEKIELRNPAAEKFAWELALEGDHRLPGVIGNTVKDVLRKRQDYLTDKLKDALHFKVGGEDHFYLLRVLILLDEKDEVFGAAVVLEDVTKLRLVDDMKGSLVSTVSHELKTPLTGLRLAVHLLLGKLVGPLNEKQEELLITARDDSERLLRTLNNLLDLARLEESKTKLELEETKLEDALEASIEHVREIAASHNQKVILEMDPDLPPVMLDRQRIGHIFTNLLTNALKHSADGEQIMVKAGRKDEESIRVRVVDHGMGIPQEHAQRIFERFYRVPGQNKTGAGLGLSIAREIARAHGGEVGVMSEEGKGSEFYVDLPLISPVQGSAVGGVEEQNKQPNERDGI